MVDNKTIRSNARAQLGNNIFSNFWLMMLVCGLIAGVISSVASSFVVGSLIVMGPLSYGLARVSVKRACGATEVDIGDVFKGFTENFVNTLVLGIMQSLFVLLWSLLFIIPGIVKSYSYAMAFYIQQDDPSKDWSTCLKESSEMMYGNRWQLFCIDFVMALWTLVGALACGIGTLFVTPYQIMSHANFYLALKASREPAPACGEGTSTDDGNTTAQL